MVKLIVQSSVCFLLTISIADLKGNCAPKFSSSYSQASVGNIFLAETRSRYDNGELLFRRNVLQVGGGDRPLFEVIREKRVH